MSEINDGGPAFPHWDGPTGKVISGLSKREWFAGMALQGYLSNPTSFGPPVPESDKYNPRLVADVSANFAYMLADAMIRAGKNCSPCHTTGVVEKLEEEK